MAKSGRAAAAKHSICNLFFRRDPFFFGQPPHRLTDTLMHSEHMTHAQWAHLQDDLMHLVENAMRSTPATREIDALEDGYEVTSVKHGQRMLVKKSPASSAFHEFLALRRSAMTLDEYMELMYCDTTAALRTQQA
ncbi:hypothetical protein As57867_005690, partial [Aphanomyces stellatus]